ncbi:MAG: amino acid permease [Candidatus Aminicenantes bacterium]|nr:amino acid permease [Candidatus Aminicenantes bacterium]
MNSSSKPTLLRKMNLIDTVFLVIGSVIGSGIFMTTGYIAGYLPSPFLILIICLTGGLVTLAGALSFAELGAMFPKAGGPYIYLREAYGSPAGFLYGWAFFAVIQCGGAAALAVGFAEYFGTFFPLFSTKNIILESSALGIPYSLSAGQLIAVLSIVLLSAINYFGIRSGVVVQNIMTLIRLGSLAALVVFGLLIGNKAGVQTMPQFFSGMSSFTFGAFGLAFIAMLWTYDGWYSASCAAGEISRPEKNVPKGLIIGTAIVALAYLLTNLVYVLALPIDRMKNVAAIGETAAFQLFGPGISILITGLIGISIFGCLSATIIYGPRVFFAMAEDGYFFRSMSFIHPRYRVPTRAITGQAIWASILCLSGTFQALYEYVVFALVIFFAAGGLAVLVLRYRQPKTPRPYKTWGYPVVPLFFVLINLAVLINTLYNQPMKSLIGLGILVVGLPAYMYWKNKIGQTQSG